MTNTENDEIDKMLDAFEYTPIIKENIMDCTEMDDTDYYSDSDDEDIDVSTFRNYIDYSDENKVEENAVIDIIHDSINSAIKSVTNEEEAAGDRSEIAKPLNGKFYTAIELVIDPRLANALQIEPSYISELVNYGNFEDISLYLKYGNDLFGKNYDPVTIAKANDSERMRFILSIYPAGKTINLTQSYIEGDDKVRDVIKEFCQKDKTGCLICTAKF